MGKLTVKEVQSIIKRNEPGRYSDDDGLYLMLPKRGSPYWMYRYSWRGQRKEYTLGKVIDLSLADARSAAADTRKLVVQNINPIAERKKENEAVIKTVNELFDDWYLTLTKRIKFPQIPHRIYTKDIGPYIGSLDITAVTPMDIRSIINRISDSNRPSIANDALLHCKQLFNHGIKLNLATYNPAAAFNVNDAGGVEKSRERALTIEELTQVFKIFRENMTSFTRDNYLACVLLVSLGVRKSELTEAHWSEFDLSAATWKLPAVRSKSGVGFIMPLPNLAIKILEELQVRACGSDYVFPNRRSSKTLHMGKDTLNRAISKMFGKDPGKAIQPENLMGNIEHFTVHDLRRTCRSLLASLGVQGHIAERCLNHKLQGVEGVYDRHDYFDERKQALSSLANHLSSFLVC